MPGKELQNFILLENQFLARVEDKFRTLALYRSSSVCLVGKGRVYLLKLSLLDRGIYNWVCGNVCMCIGVGAWILALGLKYLFINVRTQKGHSSINNIVSQLLVNCPPTPTYNSHCYYSYMFYSRYNLRFKQ